MKKNVDKFGDFEIEWKSVLRIGPQGHGLNFLFGKNSENVIAFIVGWEWLGKVITQVKVLVLSSRSKEWGRLSADPKEILEDVKEYVRIVLKDPDGKLCGEVKNNIHTMGNC
jgi:hypothetical protein